MRDRTSFPGWEIRYEIASKYHVIKVDVPGVYELARCETWVEVAAFIQRYQEYHP